MATSPNSKRAQHAWTDFWADPGSRADHSVRDAGTSQVLHQHWTNVFDRQFEAGSSVTLLDAACGDGELLRLAQRCAEPVDGLDLFLHCADISPAAVDAAARSVVSAEPPRPVVADAASLPFQTASFAVVVSQFGLEYVGASAFRDAARVTSGEGSLNALVHRQGGAVELECRANLALLDLARERGLLRRLERLIDLAARVAAGKGAPAALSRARASYGAVLDGIGAALRDAPPGAARALLQQLWQDCSKVAVSAEQYSPDQLSAWVASHAADLESYANRMQSMVDAACDDAGLADICRALEAGGLACVDVGELSTPAGGQALAWSVAASANGR